MFTRIFSCTLLVLAGCGQGGTNTAMAKASPVECALDNASGFSSDCGLQNDGDPSHLTILHPDGGFRRFDVGTDGIAAADGADGVTIRTLADGRNEITAGANRYRLKLDR